MQFESLAKSFAKKELPASEIELSGEIPADIIAPYRERALGEIALEVDMPGFRKGHVPTDIALKKVGEVGVLEEAVELFMRDFYPELLQVHAADAVGRADIRITKLAPGNPVGIIVATTVYPTVTLPKDWSKLAGKIEVETVPEVLDAEVEEALQSIRKARAKTQPHEGTSADGGAPQGDGPRTEQIPSKESAYPESAAGAEDKSAKKILPELNDEFAQSLGSFTDVADLKVKLRENMKQEKEQAAKDKRRGKIIEDLLEKTTLEVPAIFVESELEKILNQMKEDTQRFGLTFEEYLKRVEKTEDQMREEFREQARKRAKLQLTLNKLADDEKVEADKERVEEEMKHAMEHFPDARPELVRIHIETVLRNEKALQLLEAGGIK
ncbi:MAG: trigger factor [Candidatus Adlerbacteria bacterium]|nr:trigger factor [Candidatus Adlerbacteria bacterium]